MVSTKAVPSKRRAAPYDRPTDSSRNHGADNRRDSALQSVTRSISDAFGRIIGRSDSERNIRKAENATKETDNSNSSAILADSVILNQDSDASHSNVSQSIVPSQPRRVHSLASVKPQINWSLVQSSADMRLPAHVIVEAYREALENRALQQKVQQRQQEQLQHAVGVPKDSRDHAERPHTKLVESNPDKSLPSMIDSVSQSAPAKNSVIPETTSLPKFSSYQRPGRKVASVQPKHVAHSVTKARPRPIKSRIHLVSRPIVDLTKIPDERKKGPGFYTANFEISDSDSEDEQETNANPGAAGQKAGVPLSNALETPLIRRPQVESSKLRNHLEPKFSNPSANDKQPLFSVGPSVGPSVATKETSPVKDMEKKVDFQEPVSNNVAPSSSSSSEKKPLFSFGGGTAATDVSNAPTSNGSVASAVEPEKKPAFSFGAPANEKKPAFSFGASTGEKKPAFSFGAPAGEKKQDAPLFGSTTTSDGNSTKNNDATAKSAQPSFNFSVGPKSSTPSQDTRSGSESAAGGLFGFPSGKTSDAVKATDNSVKSESKKPTFDFTKSAEKAAQVSTFNPTVGTKRSFDTPNNEGGADQQKQPEQKSGDPAAPVFSFGNGTTSAKTPFMFGAAGGTGASTDPKPDSSSKPDNARSSVAPSFTFGGSSQKTASESIQPSKPPTFTFGAATNTTTNTNNANESQPAFVFGQTSTAKPLGVPSGSSTQAFGSAPSLGSGFGSSASSGFPGKPAEDKGPSTPAGAASSPAPSSVFGGISNAQPSGASSGFTFGAAKPAVPDATNGSTNSSLIPSANGSAPTFGAGSSQFGASAKPAGFTFGAPVVEGSAFGTAAPGPTGGANATPKLGTPAFGSTSTFSFGQSQPAAGGVAGTMPFGNPSGGSANTPGFGSKSATPQPGFVFGGPPAAGAQMGGLGTMPSNAPPGGTDAFQGGIGSRESTPGAGNGVIPGRKLAQVKRRLRR